MANKNVPGSGQRIEGISIESAEPNEKILLERQQESWGTPLANHLVYARCPALLHSAQGMWTGLAESGLLDPTLIALLNRRVAFINHCPF